MKLKIAPSILSADRKRLKAEVKEIESDADRIHVDIMDGKFVPPTTFQPEEIKQIKTKIPKEVHLMVEHPLQFIDAYADAGARSIIFHQESKDDPGKVILAIKKKGMKPCITIKPKTPLEKIEPYLDGVDMVLLMTVEPGYAGQKFIDGILPKIKRLRELKPKMDIEVDGGISADTIKKAVDAGANVIVAGTAIFGQKDRRKAIKELVSAAKG